MVAGAAAALYFKVSPIFVILAAAALGLVLPLGRPAPAAPPQVGQRHSYLRHLHSKGPPSPPSRSESSQRSIGRSSRWG